MSDKEKAVLAARIAWDLGAWGRGQFARTGDRPADAERRRELAADMRRFADHLEREGT